MLDIEDKCERQQPGHAPLAVQVPDRFALAARNLRPAIHDGALKQRATRVKHVLDVCQNLRLQVTHLHTEPAIAPFATAERSGAAIQCQTERQCLCTAL